MTHQRFARLAGCAAALFALALAPAFAYVVNPTGNSGDYSKWGVSNTAGTPGGVVTWGFMAERTPGSSYCGDACPGTSTLSLPIFYADAANSNAASSLSLPSVQGEVQAAFDKWSAVANVSFVYTGIDSSLNPINDAAATSPMIRVGAFAFNNSFSAAVGYSPPPNGGTGAGDLLFNTNVGFQLASGAEGSALQKYPFGGGYYMNDIRGLVLHEIGHTLGLLHSTDTTSVMCGSPTANCMNLDTVTQQLKADDIAGAKFLYGVAAPVPEPGEAALFAIGLAFLGVRLRHRSS
ncbi:MAG: matrixin family metalloprotease [Burkholderiaceae bacterium]